MTTAMKSMLVALALSCPLGVTAQSSTQAWLDSIRRAQQAEFDSIRRAQQAKFDSTWLANHTEFEDSRKQALKEYAEAVKNAWKEFPGQPAMELPDEEMVQPVFYEGSDGEATESWWSDQMDKVKGLYQRVKNALTVKGRKKPFEGNGEELPHDKVIDSGPEDLQPQPLTTVREDVDDERRVNGYLKFSLYGTEYQVRIGDNCRPMLPAVTTSDIAEVLKSFLLPQYDNMLYDCLQEREKHQLSDWAYYQMLQALTDTFYGKGSNEGALVLAFLYSQSGYKMRIAHNGTSVFMLAASKHLIYRKEYLMLDDGDRYYLLDGRKMGERICYACQKSFDNEGAMSLQLSAEQYFSLNECPRRTITSLLDTTFSFTVISNKNYLDFYENYPRSTIGDNVMTQWMMYAETPLEKGVRTQLYPPMRRKLQGLTQKEAVQTLLSWVQTGFKYAYDNDVWGGDRPFFGEETLFYPYCDCEDRAILFSHLVRDLVGLDVVLVYYPNHLATAVAFTEDVAGDYFVNNDGRKFTVCDPTYIRGGVGGTMPIMKGKSATIMLLKR